MLFNASDARHALGRRGERKAARYLKHHGYKVLRRNWRGPKGGEIDLVCRDVKNDVLAFVEVKTRSSLEYGRPSAAVDAAKQRLIVRGGMSWLRLLDDPEVAFRFDVMEIIESERGLEYNLVQGAFHLPERYMF